jgi:hypothetical protein
MTGSFSSEEQATADSSYFDIRLQMARIWSERTGSYVFLKLPSAPAEKQTNNPPQ